MILSKLKVEKVVRPPIRPAVKKALSCGCERICGEVKKIPISREPRILTLRVAKGIPKSTGVLLKSRPVSARKIAPRAPPKPTQIKVKFAEDIIKKYNT